MRFLVAAVAFTAVSTPAFASDVTATSRAIPPIEGVEMTAGAAAAPAGMSDLVFRPAPADAVEDAVTASPPIAKPKIAPAVVPAQRGSEAQQICVAQAVYYESKGEPLRGQRAVADVVINRTRRPGFASTPCGVIRQPHQFTNAHRWRIPSATDPLWKIAREVARNAMQGIGTVSEAITHFHAARVRPGWGMRRIAAIGGHVFY